MANHLERTIAKNIKTYMLCKLTQNAHDHNFTVPALGECERKIKWHEREYEMKI